MRFYTITANSERIAVHRSAQEAASVSGAQGFSSEAGLAKLATEWPTSRLIRIWNGLPGVVPVNRFTSRKLAITRIWATIEKRGDQPVAAVQNQATVRKSGHRSGRLPARERGGSRAEAILSLLRRSEGTTIEALKKATGWQAHSVRGFISGTIRKKMKLTVTCAPDVRGTRVYRLEAK
jgi:hypothetical protein